MKKILIASFTFFIVIGIVAFIPFYLTGTQPSVTILSYNELQIAGWTWKYYTIDVKQYLLNLENSLSLATFKKLIADPPNLPPETTVISGIVNYILYGINWIIYILNYVILGPIKIILYPINILLTVIGFNTTNSSYVETIDLLYKFQLPFIEYIQW